MAIRVISGRDSLLRSHSHLPVLDVQSFRGTGREAAAGEVVESGLNRSSARQVFDCIWNGCVLLLCYFRIVVKHLVWRHTIDEVADRQTGKEEKVPIGRSHFSNAFEQIAFEINVTLIPVLEVIFSL